MNTRCFQKKPNFINFVLLKCCMKICTGHLRPVSRAALLLSLQWHTMRCGVVTVVPEEKHVNDIYVKPKIP